MTCGSWSEGQHDPYFMVQWFCPIFWRLFDVWTSYFGITSHYDPTCDLKINVGHCDLHFMVQWFCLISWRLMYEHHTWDCESVWPDVWPQNKCWSLRPIFYGPVPSWSLFDVWTSYFGIMSQYDTTFNLKINVGHCDLYFMVQWFCLISWRLSDIWTPYFGIMSQYDLMFDLKIFVGHWSIFHGPVILHSRKLFSDWTSYFGIMSQYDQTSDLKMFVGHCDLYFMVHRICLISWMMYEDHTLGLWVSMTRHLTP